MRPTRAATALLAGTLAVCMPVDGATQTEVGRTGFSEDRRTPRTSADRDPNNPPVLSVSDGSWHLINYLAWTSMPGAYGYEIHHSRDQSTWTHLHTARPAWRWKYSHGPDEPRGFLEPGTTHYYRIRTLTGRNGQHHSAWSNVVEGTTCSRSSCNPDKVPLKPRDPEVLELNSGDVETSWLSLGMLDAINYDIRAIKGGREVGGDTKRSTLVKGRWLHERGSL